MFAKLSNGKLREAPANYRGIINYNRYPERMAEDGYKPVENTPMPEDGQEVWDDTDELNPVLVKPAEKHYESHWEERGDKIVKVWDEVAGTNS